MSNQPGIPAPSASSTGMQQMKQQLNAQIQQQAQFASMAMAAAQGPFRAGGLTQAPVPTTAYPLKRILPDISDVRELPADCRIELWQVVVSDTHNYSQPTYDVRACALMVNPAPESAGIDNGVVSAQEIRLLFRTEVQAREWVQAQVRATFRQKAKALVAELVQAGLERGLLADADLDVADALRKYAEGAR